MNINENKYRFKFKQFGINDSQCAMKIGTDGVLLGAWCDISTAQKVLDVGSGSGLISLMVAQRCNASITGIEIDPLATKQSIENINNSPWSNRISIFNSDFIKWASSTSQRFDHIVSNPPFFNCGPNAPSSARATARHEASLGYEQLINYSKLLLTHNGKISFISPIERKDDIIFYCELAHMYISRLTNILSKENGKVNRLLWEITLNKCITQYSEFAIRTIENNYTEDYINLTKDFYLHFN